MFQATRLHSTPAESEYFVICGLGSLGQHCITALTEFGVKIVAIEQQLPISWEIESLRDLLVDLIIGDCRHNDILERAKIDRCRAALIVTTDDRVNVETAIAIRQLNPKTRLVVRSGKQKLNQLLSVQLGNYLAFDPRELSTSAFTLAALGTEIRGYFELNGRIWQIYQRSLAVGDRWCDRSLFDLENNYRKVLAHSRHKNYPSLTLGNWNAREIIRQGDTVAYLQIATDLDLQLSTTRFTQAARNQGWLELLKSRLQQAISIFSQLNFRQQIRRVALVSGIVLLGLLLLGTWLFRWYYPEITTISAFFATAILLLGGYGDLFPELEDISLIPWWLRLFSLLLTLVGTVFVGVMYALLTEALLSARFELNKQPVSIPQEHHVAIVGMGKTGQKVTALLQKFQQPWLGITFNPDFYQQYNSEIPLIIGNLETALAKANLTQATSAVIVTDDEILNLEVALMIGAIAPKLNIVLKTSGRRIAQHLRELLPELQIVGVYAEAAAAFAGAAFGENIISLFRLGERTILVTEYQIETDDTLNGLLLDDIAYGYGVVPILYQQPNRASVLLPCDELPLRSGDRLVVLATIDGLRRIEQGRLNLEAKQWQVSIERTLTPDAIFEGANVIVRVTGCSLTLARKTMNDLPQALPILLYQHQAQRLIRELRKTLVIAVLMGKQERN
ncbi:MAG: NAD-binding protein [Pleurocapsa sp. MO_226.B13]|nr:NAD-binding protein [Pleurocapsa sp. MO_226.B13]